MPDTLMSTPPANNDILGKSLNAGKWGATGGAALGALQAVLSKDKDYLKNTLAGAMLGALGAGGFTAYHLADPFQRGGMAGTAYQSAMQRALGEAVAGRPVGEAGSAALQEGLVSLLSGKGQFTPEEQSSLVQQFTQSVLPTSKGWQRRLQLAGHVADQLKSGNARRAYKGLRVMAEVMPDMDMRTAAQHALERIESGRFNAPEEAQELAALGERIKSRLGIYQKATPALEELTNIKGQFGSGKLSNEQFAQRVGLLTGRFGSQTDDAKRMRQFLQEVIARPVNKAPATSLDKTMLASPAIGDLISGAMEPQ